MTHSRKKKARTTSFPQTLQEIISYFGNPDNCLNYLVSRRWPNGVICPTCGRDDVTYLAKQSKWQCKSAHAKRQFTVKIGTIFEDSPLGLGKWLTAVWLITNAKNGISSYEVSRALDVTQKTAWFMVHRIRVAMRTGSFENKLSGTVEADETFVGGKAVNMHRGVRKARGTGMGGKVPVLGVLQRGGEVRATVVPNTRVAALQPHIRQHVEQGSNLYTDFHNSYLGMAEYNHSRINHAKTYVDGDVHTNNMENFWSLLKRAIKGTYVSVEAFHLFRYVDEQAFRFNTRKGNDGDRFEKVTSQLADKRLTYAELTGKEKGEARPAH